MLLLRRQKLDSDLIWLAGLLEGEGNFTPTKKKSTNSNIIYYHARVVLNMTDEDIVNRAHEVIGCGSIQRTRRKIEGHKQELCLIIQGPKAIELMLSILPYMGKRRSERIREVLELVHESRILGKTKQIRRSPVENA